MARSQQISTVAPNTKTESRDTLSIQLFGPMEVSVNGLVIDRLPSRRAMWLLAILALRNGRPIERQNLAGILWPDSTDSGALHNLRQTLANLRKVLGSAGNYIETVSPRSILLRADVGIWVDAVQFDLAAKRESVDDWVEAINLYRGSLFIECDEPFAVEARSRREQTFLGLADKVAAHYLANHDFLAAKEVLHRAISIDPFKESSYRTLMVVLYESRETAAALESYRNLRLTLRRELNADPDHETTALYRSIRSGKYSKIESVDPRLKRDERIPLPLTSLLGRDKEVREVIGLLDRCRLVTLTGVGGVGKTRLAIAVAEAMSGKPIDGARFIDLSSVQDPDQVLTAIASSLQVAERAGHSMRDLLSEQVRDLEVLILLDNCEHILDGVTPCMELLLSSGPRIHILATSRQSTGVAGELVWRVPSLSFPESIPSGLNHGTSRLDYLKQCDSVRLFLERSDHHRGNSEQSEAEYEVIGSICRRLDGIPLAIELAAARTNVLSPFEIERRLHDRFDILTKGTQSVARHQTLAATIEWSWDLLTDAERKMMMRLCVFWGGWTLESAEAMSRDEVDPSSVLDLVSDLVDRSMIVYSRNSEFGRFTMLETIRQFVTDKLRHSQDWTAVHNRHQTYFHQLAESAKSNQHGYEESIWFKRIETEHDNILSALDWAHQLAEHEIGLALAVAMSRFWDTHGHLTEGRNRLERSIMLAESVASPLLMAGARVHAGWMAGLAHDFQSAKNHYERAIPYYREKNDQPGLGKVLNCLAVAAKNSGDFALAQSLFEESFVVFSNLQMLEAVSTVLGNLGDMALAMDNNDAARDYLQRSIAVVDDQPRRNQETLAQTLGNLSLVEFRQYRFSEAREIGQRSLQIFAEIEAIVSIPEGISQVALTETAFNDWTRVARLLGASDNLAATQGVPFQDKQIKERVKAEEQASRHLGPAEFRLAYRQGNQMSMQEAIEYALETYKSEI